MDNDIQQQLNKLFKKLDAKSNGISNTIEKSLTKGCLRVERDAKMLARVDTGRLRESITHRIRKELTGDLTGEVGTNVEYAAYVEFGTGKYASKGDGRKTPWAYKDPKTGKTIWTHGSRPKPFLFPAFKQNKDKVKSDIATDIKKVINDV